MMHLLHKGFMENYQCWYAHVESCSDLTFIFNCKYYL
jgi:hypothetical protein